MSIGKKLKALREESGLSIRVMAEEVGMKVSTYQHYEDRYKKRHLPLQLEVALWPILVSKGVPEKEILKVVRPESSQLAHVQAGLVHAPLISWVQAGKARESWERPLDEAETVPVPYHRNSLVCLRVEGNSMNREAPPGSIIAVDYQDIDPIDGKYYVAVIDGEATFKRFRAKPPRLEPDSHESGHEGYYKDFRIVGRVVFVLREI